MDEVEKSLLHVQRDFEKINETLDMLREPMRDEILFNLLEGYMYVNYLLSKDIYIMERANLHHFLELNNIVLCGIDKKRRKNYEEHIQLTTERFYYQKDFNISTLRKWAKAHKHNSPWKIVSGLYIQHVSRPQLFFEGNHRTGALMMSSILVLNEKPPFVLCVDNAKGYFDPSSLAKSTHKTMMGKYYKLPKIKVKFAKFLKNQAARKFLVAN